MFEIFNAKTEETFCYATSEEQAERIVDAARGIVTLDYVSDDSPDYRPRYPLIPERQFYLEN